MVETLDMLAALRRPRLLISAARFGLAQYDREAGLNRIFGDAVPAPGLACVTALMEREAEIDTARRSASGVYSIAEHVEVLAAIMAESRLLPRPASSAPRLAWQAEPIVLAERRAGRVS